LLSKRTWLSPLRLRKNDLLGRPLLAMVRPSSEAVIAPEGLMVMGDVVVQAGANAAGIFRDAGASARLSMKK
jgi:hypothetical protein